MMAAALARLIHSQTMVDLRTQGRNIDFSLASSTRPLKVGAGLPAICSLGELFFRTDVAAGSNLLICVAPNTWVQASGGGGEANTASNVGLGGVGVFQQKVGADLRFKRINAASARLVVVDDTVNSEVDLDVAEASLNLANLGGGLNASQIAGASKQGNGGKVAMFSGAAPVSGNCVRWDTSGNVSDAGAPCGTGSGGSLPAQGGHAGKFLRTDGSAANWSHITQLQGFAVSANSPASGQTLVYNGASNQWEPGSVSGAGSILAGTGIVVSGGNTVSIDSATVPTFLTATLNDFDFPPISGHTCANATMTLTGAATMDPVIAGWSPNLEQGLSGTMFVSAINQVTIRLCNALGTTVDPPAQHFKATIIRSF
jgi:hypothetical protein